MSKKPNVVACVPFDLLFREIKTFDDDEYLKMCGCGGAKRQREEPKEEKAGRHKPQRNPWNLDMKRKYDKQEKGDQPEKWSISSDPKESTLKKRSVSPERDKKEKEADNNDKARKYFWPDGKYGPASKTKGDGRKLSMRVEPMAEKSESVYTLGGGKTFAKNFRIKGKDDVTFKVTFEVDE